MVQKNKRRRKKSRRSHRRRSRPRVKRRSRLRVRRRGRRRSKRSYRRRSRRRSPKRRRSRRTSRRRRSGRRRSRRTSRRRRSGRKLKKSTQLTQPLTIYTSEGCSACVSAKELCDKKGIKYCVLDRRKHSTEVNKRTGNCRFVPNIFNANKEYIGGNEVLIKLTKGMKNVK